MGFEINKDRGTICEHFQNVFIEESTMVLRIRVEIIEALYS
jgi:hypothetical protein